MLKICFCGILIGTFALALIMCIMHGTEKVTHSKLRGIHSTIIMRAYGDDLNLQQIAPILGDEFPEIVAWSPITTKQAIIQDTDSSDITNVVAVKAIDPEKVRRGLTGNLCRCTGYDSIIRAAMTAERSSGPSASAVVYATPPITAGAPVVETWTTCDHAWCRPSN